MRVVDCARCGDSDDAKQVQELAAVCCRDLAGGAGDGFESTTVVESRPSGQEPRLWKQKGKCVPGFAPHWDSGAAIEKHAQEKPRKKNGNEGTGTSLAAWQGNCSLLV